jgi:hypothetical protein
MRLKYNKGNGKGILTTLGGIILWDTPTYKNKIVTDTEYPITILVWRIGIYIGLDRFRGEEY